jgi:hypothetical protein
MRKLSPVPAPSLSKHLPKKAKSEPGAVFVLDCLAHKDIYRVKLTVAIARDVCLQQIQRYHPQNTKLRMPNSKVGSCALVADTSDLQHTGQHLIGFNLRHIVRRFGGPSFISFFTLIVARVSSIAAGCRKYRRVLERIVNRVFGGRLSELLESQMRCAIAKMTITRPEKHMFCPFLLALKKEAEKMIEGEVDVWTAAELGDDWLVELHVLAFVQEPDCWCCGKKFGLCDFARNSGKMTYFCCIFDRDDDENV